MLDFVFVAKGAREFMVIARLLFDPCSRKRREAGKRCNRQEVLS